MVSALMPYGVVAAILLVMLMALPAIGVLATVSAVAVLTAGRGKDRR